MRDIEFINKRKFYSDENNSEEAEHEKKKSKTDIWNGSIEQSSIEVFKNHIYFYSGVTTKSCLKLNIELKKLSQAIIDDGKNFYDKNKYIYLHINSFGGSVFASFSTIDTILNLPVPVISIIEGAAASAATLISVICNYRIIYKNSFMLIHQLSSSTWGKMADLEDEMENLKKLMENIKKIYKNNTKINELDLDNILKHDIWWDANKCLKQGLVDQVIKKKKLAYDFDPDNIDI